jgi:hypothetical protein
MGSLGRLVGGLPGQGSFLKNHAIKTALEPPRGRPFGGGGVHRIREYAGISPHLCNPLNTCVTYLKQRKAIHSLISDEREEEY